MSLSVCIDLGEDGGRDPLPAAAELPLYPVGLSVPEINTRGCARTHARTLERERERDRDREREREREAPPNLAEYS
jgi:hypothetical protein